MRFHRNQGRKKYFRGSQRKSVFGGTVKSVAEIEALSNKIKKQEAKEFAQFEKIFDADLRTIS